MVTNNAINEATAASGTVLQGQGVGTKTAFSTATYPSATVGTGKILFDNGTNFVASTPTFPASASATSRKIIVSDGTNWTASTETWAVPGTSGNVLTSDGTNWTSAANSTVGNVLTATLSLTNAQLKALFTTPITILAAQGAGIVINVINFFVKFIYGGTNAFTLGGNFELRYQNGTGTVITTALTNSIFLGTNSSYTFGPPTLLNSSTVNITTMDNQPVVAHMATQNLGGNAANNNTAKVQIAYTLVSI